MRVTVRQVVDRERGRGGERGRGREGGGAETDTEETHNMFVIPIPYM